MSEKDYFCGINKPNDLSAITDFEKKHTPVIECPDTVTAGEPFAVSIKVGEIPHVMEVGHFVQWAVLESGENPYCRVDFTPVFTKPEATVTLVKGAKHGKATLRVLARCNLHGLWEASKEIQIKGA